MTKEQMLSDGLCSPEPYYIMEAHNGLTARLVEEAGFKAVWASGLTISASMGLRDCNEASWTQVLAVAEQMADAVDVPVLMDGDTGFGNFNNARRLCRKAQQRGIAGVVIEDKCFPKRNSFADGRQPLAPLEEMVGKLQACKDEVDDLVVIARCESLIAGHGMHDAIGRLEAYAEVADAVVLHSKGNGQGVLDFGAWWQGERRQEPLIVIPTTYPRVEEGAFLKRGISNYIWANHTLRTMVTAARLGLDMVRHEGLMSLERKIASVKDIFELTNMLELKRAEERYAR